MATPTPLLTLDDISAVKSTVQDLQFQVAQLAEALREEQKARQEERKTHQEEQERFRQMLLAMRSGENQAAASDGAPMPQQFADSSLATPSARGNDEVKIEQEKAFLPASLLPMYDAKNNKNRPLAHLETKELGYGSGVESDEEFERQAYYGAKPKAFPTIMAVCMLRDGKIVISSRLGDYDKIEIFLDTNQVDCIYSKEFAEELILSQNGLLRICDETTDPGSMKVLDLNTQKPVKLDVGMDILGISPMGKLLYCSDDNPLLSVLEGPLEKFFETFAYPQGIQIRKHVSFLSERELFVLHEEQNAQGEKATLYPAVWNYETGQYTVLRDRTPVEKLNKRQSGAEALECFPLPNQVCVLVLIDQLCVWDLKSNQCQYIQKAASKIKDVISLENGNFILTYHGVSDHIDVWNAEEGTAHSIPHKFSHRNYELLFNPMQETLIEVNKHKGRVEFFDISRVLRPKVGNKPSC